MTGKERSVLKMIVKHFFDSLKLKSNKDKLIGEDYFGTKYYEVHTKSALKRPSRYFVPVNKDDHEQELPVEWESWLRHRRKEPPTLEEIKTNYELQMTKKENADKINAIFPNKELEGPGTFMQKSEQIKFPIYEEYEHRQDHQITDEKKSSTQGMNRNK